MPWKELTPMSQREEFVQLASVKGANISLLSTRFGISRPTAYKWLARHKRGEPLTDRSRRPRHHPRQTPEAIEALVLSVIALPHQEAWRGRKIATYLLNQGHPENEVPSPSTITKILRRNGIDDPEKGSHRGPFQRFERDGPNDLWQMDFKGHFSLTAGKRCHPLTILDDHSRFALGVIACTNERFNTVKTALSKVFGRYGLPRQILTDNGSPWGSSARSRYGHALTHLEIWLMRQGVELIHSRPYHPQTSGKIERFHRTLKREVLRYHAFKDAAHCQEVFDPWRNTYNLKRTHESLNDRPPAHRYTLSKRSYTGRLEPVCYPKNMHIRSVNKGGVMFKGRHYQVGEALNKLKVGVLTDKQTKEMNVYFCHKLIRTFKL